MDVQPSARKPAQQRTRTTGMIQVDMSDDDVSDLLGIEPGLPDAGKQCLHRARGPRLDKGQRIAVRDEIRGDYTRRPSKVMIQQKDAGLDFAGQPI